MTTPTIAPTGYALSDNDFLHAKVDRSGAVRLVSGYVAVPATTATTTVIGLAPFRKGAKLSYGSRLYTGDLDTSTNVTLDFGYVYDDAVTNTSDPNAFIAAVSAQTAGALEMTALEGMTFTAAADGWFAVTVGGGATTTTGNITFSLGIAYDPSGVTNA